VSLRALAGRLSDERSLRRRRPPTIRTSARGQALAGTPTIYYLCPNYSAPSGGIRAIYRHVDILNHAGRSAAVLHHRDGDACRWFEHSTRTAGIPSVRLSPEDVLVVPEIYGPFLDRLPRGPRLVAFNQNAYLTYEHMPAGRLPSYDIFAAALTVSEDSAELLRFAFPDLDVSIVPNAIDPGVFHPLEGAQSQRRRIAMMPRKRPTEAQLVLRLLGARLDGWETVAIEGAPERETAALLRSAPIFLALGKREGFGLPAAEAMASGCYVVGFAGFGGREIFEPEFSTSVEDGDVLALARELANLLEVYERSPESLRERAARACAHVRARYSLERQRRELLTFYEHLLG
jgi:glycosyltransferase involved in cell wall biosynthesis